MYHNHYLLINKYVWLIISIYIYIVTLYIKQSDALVLKVFDKLALNGIVDTAFSNQRKGRVASLCTCFYKKFSNVSSSSDDQNLTFLSHWSFFFMGEQEEKWIIKLRRYKFSRRCIEPSSQFIDWNERVAWGPVSYFGKSVSIIIGKITLTIFFFLNNKLCCQNQAINTY